MALKSSGFCGTNTLHELKGCTCDLCGNDADSEAAECVAIDCSFPRCNPEACLYHQACLEKYLKSIKCERNRKIGFPCPRGCGRATKYSSPCPGKVLKSHPISIRGEANKKRRQAELESLQRSDSKDKEDAKAGAAAAGGAKAAKKEEGSGKAGRGSPEDKSQKGAKAGAAPAKTASIKTLHVSSSKLTPASSSIAAPAATAKSAAAAKKEQLAAAARNLKNEIAARSGSGIATKSSATLASASSGASLASHASKTKEVKTLDEYLAERQSSSLERATSSASGAAATASNAWAAKSRASSASSLATDTAGEATPTLLDSEAFPPPPLPAAAAATRPPLPLPRLASSASASTTASQPAVPAPAKPPPPRGAWAQKQPAVMSIVPPPPPPPRGAGAVAAPGAPPPPPPAAPKPAAAPVAVPEQQPPEADAQQQQAGAQTKLSKSQRKNLRRAEKKAGGSTTGRSSQDAAELDTAGALSPRYAVLAPPPPPPPPPYSPRVGESDPCSPSTVAIQDGSHAYYPTSPSHLHHLSSQEQLPPEALCALSGNLPPGPPPPPLYMEQQQHPQHHQHPHHMPPPLPMAPVCGDLLDRCLQLVVQHKLQKQVESLASLGFPPGAALAAVQQHGGNLEAAVTTLLEQATGVCDTAMVLGGSQGPLPEVDLSEELAFMQALQYRYRLAPGVLESAVVDCNGDLEVTARLVAEQCGDAASSDGSSTSALTMGATGPEPLGGGNLFEPALAHTPHHHPQAVSPPALPSGGWGGWEGGPASHSSPQQHFLGSGMAGAGFGELVAESGGPAALGGGPSFGTYSAFSFGGFTEAALSAVHGGPYGAAAGGGGGGSGAASDGGQSLFSSLDTPRHSALGAVQSFGRAAGGGGGLGLWGGEGPSGGMPPSPQAASPMYAAQMLGVRAGPRYGGGELAHAPSPFDQRPPMPMSPTYPAHGLVADDSPRSGPGGLYSGGRAPPQQQEGWAASESWARATVGRVELGGGADYYGSPLQQQHAQQPGLLPATQQQQQQQHGGGGQQYQGRLLEERELSDLMSTLLCR